MTIRELSRLEIVCPMCGHTLVVRDSDFEGSMFHLCVECQDWFDYDPDQDQTEEN